MSLTATPSAGFEFVGWGGELAGTTASTASVTMDSNKIVTAVFQPTDPPATVQISSVDHPAIPAGETMTFTGSGFTGVTSATFYWAATPESAAVEVVSDTELRVTFPDISQGHREHLLLLETPDASTVTAAGEFAEFTGTGNADSLPGAEQLIVKAGAVLQDLPFNSQYIYVESGGVLQNPPGEAPNVTIFVEDGATLDLRGTNFSIFAPPRIIYSAGATILGDLPPAISGRRGSLAPRQVSSLSLSRDIGPFSSGVSINLSVVGNGSASADPAGSYIPEFSNYTLTATPDPGWVFQGWSGSASGSSPVLSAYAGTDELNVVATFTEGFTLEVFSGSQGTVSLDPEMGAYAPGQQVSLAAVPAAGFQFVGWGGALAGSTTSSDSITMDSHKLVTAIFEPINSPPVIAIDLVDHPILPIGETMTFTGSGFADTSSATFHWAGFEDAAEFAVVSDTELRVTFPDVFQSTRERFLLLETPVASTVTVAGELTEFTGIGNLDSVPAESQVVVTSGSILQGFSPSVSFIYVESGAVLQSLPATARTVTIFAEDGATLDLRGTAFSPFPPRILYSPGTTILGDLPIPTGGSILSRASKQISPVSLSRNIGPFQEGFALSLTIEGPGSVTVDPVQDFYTRETEITLTATPSPGNFFVRWSGGLSSTTNPITLRMSGSTPIMARFSNRPDFFSEWRSRFFLTPEELADPEHQRVKRRSGPGSDHQRRRVRFWNRPDGPGRPTRVQDSSGRKSQEWCGSQA